MKDKKLKDELRELSPWLSRMKEKDEGYDVPANYFSSLTDEVMGKVAKKPEPVVSPSRNWLDELAAYLQGFFRPRYALALASVAVLVVAGIFYLNRGGEEDCPDMLACIPDETIETYVQQNIDEFDSNLFEPYLTRHSASTPALELEEMEQYLDEMIDDIEVEDLEAFL